MSGRDRGITELGEGKGGAEPRGGKTERRTKTQRNWRVKKKKTEGTSKGDTKTVRGIGQLTHECQPRPRVRHPLLPPNRRTRRKRKVNKHRRRKNRGPVEREKNGRRETVRESREQREQNNRKRKSNEQEGSLKRGVSPIHSSKVSAKPGKFFLLPAL
jgi:hypothetical protein